MAGNFSYSVFEWKDVIKTKRKNELSEALVHLFSLRTSKVTEAPDNYTISYFPIVATPNFGRYDHYRAGIDWINSINLSYGVVKVTSLPYQSNSKSSFVLPVLTLSEILIDQGLDICFTSTSLYYSLD